MPAAEPSLFTIAEWEEVVRRKAEGFEDRKREYLRWTATGIAAIATLVGLLIQRIASAAFASYSAVAVAVSLVAAYLLHEAVWNLSLEKVTQAVNTIIGAHRPEHVWDIVTEPAEVAQRPLTMVFAEFLWPVGVTVLLAAAAAVPTPAATTLLDLAVFRVVLIGLLATFVFLYRQAKRQLPNAPRTRMSAFLVGKATQIVYYGPQVWLVVVAWTYLTVPGLDTLVVVLLAIGVLGITRWIWRIAWPLVNFNARAMGAFLQVHDAILMGYYRTADEVAAAVNLLYNHAPPQPAERSER